MAGSSNAAMMHSVVNTTINRVCMVITFSLQEATLDLFLNHFWLVSWVMHHQAVSVNSEAPSMNI